jgi:hypothetical protein
MDMTLLFSPRGAIGRRPFWIGTLAAVILTIAGFVIEYLAKGGSSALTGAVVSLLLQLVAWVITFMLAIKRLRALGQSPWYVLLLFVPVINLIWYIVIGLDSEDASPEGDSLTDAGPDAAPAMQRVAVSGVRKFASIAALAWYCVVSAWLTADVLGRYLFRAPVSGLLLDWTDNPDSIHVMFGWLAVIVALAGVAVLFIGDRDNQGAAGAADSRLHWRSRLAVWPGIPVAIVIGVVGILALAGFSGAPIGRIATMLRFLAVGQIGSVAAPALLLPVLIAALLTRSRWSSAAIAAPFVFLIVSSYMLEASIMKNAVALIPFAFVLAVCSVGAAVLLSKRSRERSAALAFGAGLVAVCFFGALMTSGIVTPYEGMGIAGFPVLLLAAYRQKRTGGSVLEAFSRGAVDVAGIIAGLLLLAVVAANNMVLLRNLVGAISLGIGGLPAATLVVPVLLPIAFAVLAFFVTPLMALVVSMPVLLAFVPAGYDPGWLVNAVVLSGMAGMAARMAADRPYVQLESQAAPEVRFYKAVSVILLAGAISTWWLYGLSQAVLRFVGV